jgi:hypothetical protein
MPLPERARTSAASYYMLRFRTIRKAAANGPAVGTRTRVQYRAMFKSEKRRPAEVEVGTLC